MKYFIFQRNSHISISNKILANTRHLKIVECFLPGFGASQDLPSPLPLPFVNKRVQLTKKKKKARRQERLGVKVVFCGRQPNCILDKIQKDLEIILLQLLNKPSKVSFHKLSILKTILSYIPTVRKQKIKIFNTTYEKVQPTRYIGINLSGYVRELYSKKY